MSSQTSLKAHLIKLTLQMDELRWGVHLCNGALVHHYDPEESEIRQFRERNQIDNKLSQIDKSERQQHKSGKQAREMSQRVNKKSDDQTDESKDRKEKSDRQLRDNKASQRAQYRQGYLLSKK